MEKEREKKNAPGIHNKRNKPLILKVQLAHQIIPRQLGHAVRRQRRPRAVLHIGNSTNRRTDIDKLWHSACASPAPSLQQRARRLEQEQDRVRIHHHVGLQVSELHQRRWTIVLCDGGVGDHDVEVLDPVVRLQFLNCGCGVGFRGAVEFYDYEGCGVGFWERG